MTLLQDFYINTGEIPPLPGPPPRRPDASTESPMVERRSFAVLSPSGELPIAFIQQVRPRPDVTARIVISSSAQQTEPADGPRPWFYRGQHRLTRSAALLTAATWTGGVR